MKKLILHVGTHKTGTTALQSFFSLNEERLSDLGIAVPRFSKYQKIGKGRNGLFLSRGARTASCPGLSEPGDEGRIARDLKSFSEVLNQYDAVLLSDESIWYEGSWREAFWQKLRQLVDSAGVDQTEIVVYLRRQDEYICSYWRQAVKSLFSPTPLNELLRDEGSRAYRSLDYRATLTAIERHFGKDALKVRVYDRGSFIGGDIFHDFCQTIGVPWQEGFAIPGSDVNPSYSDLGAELKRWANMSEAYSLSSDFLRGPVASLSAVDGGRGQMKLLSRDDYERLKDAFYGDDLYIAERYLGGEGGALTEWSPCSWQEWDSSSEEVSRAIVQLFAEAMANQEQKTCIQQKTIDALQEVMESQEEMLSAQRKAIEDLRNRVNELEEANRASLVSRIKRRSRRAK